MRHHQIHTDRIISVARALGALNSEVVFVGGAIVSLYLDDAYSALVRATADVDCVISVATRQDFAKIEGRLRKLGFQHRFREGDPICRWTIHKIVVDVMPSDPRILGFSNIWYSEALEQTRTIPVGKGIDVRIPTLPFFLAMKIAAFLDRGKNDFIASSDMEDIITLLEGSSNVTQEIASSPLRVKTYLKKNFKNFTTNESFHDAVFGNFALVESGEARANRLIAVLNEIISPK